MRVEGWPEESKPIVNKMATLSLVNIAIWCVSECVCSNSQVVDINTVMVPASQRMTLSIPLHPDQIGSGRLAVLAAITERIETDCQKNGDFGFRENLKRAPGIG